MGLFSKISSNLHHGGVKVHLQAPASLTTGVNTPISVAITADSTQSINGVKLELKMVTRESGMDLNGGIGVQESRDMAQTVAQAEDRTPLNLVAGETGTVTIPFTFTGGASGNPLGQFTGNGSALGNVLGTVVAAAQSFENVNRTYTLHAIVDVAGVSMDPSDKQAIQILPPAPTAAVSEPQSGQAPTQLQ